MLNRSLLWSHVLAKEERGAKFCKGTKRNTATFYSETQLQLFFVCYLAPFFQFLNFFKDQVSYCSYVRLFLPSFTLLPRP